MDKNTLFKELYEFSKKIDFFEIINPGHPWMELNHNLMYRKGKKHVQEKILDIFKNHGYKL